MILICLKVLQWSFDSELPCFKSLWNVRVLKQVSPFISSCCFGKGLFNTEAQYCQKNPQSINKRNPNQPFTMGFFFVPPFPSYKTWSFIALYFSQVLFLRNSPWKRRLLREIHRSDDLTHSLGLSPPPFGCNRGKWRFSRWDPRS